MTKQRSHTQHNTVTKNVPFLSKNPEKAIQEMMSTIDDLRSVYKTETEALLVADTQTFLDIQAEKLKAAQRYQCSVEEMLTRKDEMQGINPLTKKRLEDMQKDFFALSKKNMEALQRMQRTTERLGLTIRKAAKNAAQKQRAFSYGETGALKGDDGKLVSTGISETA